MEGFGIKELGIIGAILFGALTLGARKVWSFKWAADELVAALNAAHERERIQWAEQMAHLRETCAKAEAREKELFAIAFERRDVVAKAVDLAINKAKASEAA